jgi:cysteinyl-tRNA synthetase
MSEKHLGTSFEIHGGGLDLKFPHHENEIAQSRALGHDFARAWMHNGMLSFAGAEMHKSLGNDVSLKDALDRWGRENVLVFFMTGHWRKPLDYSEETLAQAKAQADTFRNFFLDTPAAGEPQEQERLAEVLDDDFNTPDALALFHEWRGRGLAADVRAGLDVFGLASLAAAEDAPAELLDVAARRRDARAARDFGEADRLRDEILAAGWEVRDEAGGFRLVRRA